MVSAAGGVSAATSQDVADLINQLNLRAEEEQQQANQQLLAQQANLPVTHVTPDNNANSFTGGGASAGGF